MNSTVILLLGGNLGDRKATLEKAAQEIVQSIGEITSRSALYTSDAWGKTDQPTFLNQALIVSTHLSPTHVLAAALGVESKLGRTRTEKWGARIIDIDLLYYENKIIDTKQLTIPHPGIATRRFALEPLAEVAPTFMHPILKKDHRQLLAECTDTLRVVRL